jgi:hypothetical protein
MITDLKITHNNDDETFRHFVQSGRFMYKATYKIPTLFGDVEKIFNCQGMSELSNDYIKNKIIEYHLNEI